MIIFSRKTHGIVGETHHFRKPPYISSLAIKRRPQQLSKIHKHSIFASLSKYFNPIFVAMHRMGRKMIWKSCAESAWRRWSPTIRWGFSQRSYHQKFQVPKVEGFLNLIRLFWRWGFPYITLTYCLYRWGFLHFRYLKCLVMVFWEHKHPGFRSGNLQAKWNQRHFVGNHKAMTCHDMSYPAMWEEPSTTMTLQRNTAFLWDLK